MNRRTGAIAGTALVGILLLVATTLWAGPGPVPSEVPPSVGDATDAPSPSPLATALPPPASTAPMRSDFNGDGFADLAIGVPRWDLGVFHNAGGVHVLYGSIDGSSRVGKQFWSRDSPDVLGSADVNDEFGSALASGDFDGDGYADLAVGAPDIGTGTNAGGVNVLFGSARGLTSGDNELWLVADLLGTPESVDSQGGLGAALASGDFDGDGFADLAIESPSAGDAGSGSRVVVLLHGGPEGLQFRGRWLSGLGYVLAAGDLNGDGRDDLAASAFRGDGGEVAVFYGSQAGLASEGSQRWSQESPGVQGTPSRFDQFGAALAIGDFDDDGFGDLAVGDYAEGADCAGPCSATGAVVVLRGSASGLTADGSQLWNEGTPGVPGNPEKKDLFGWSLAAGDFDGDGADDLAIGAPGEDPSRRSRPRGTGAVTVLYGSPEGLTTSRAERWTQDSPGVPGGARPNEAFGESLSSAQFGGSTMDDLVIGVPRERVPEVGHVGMVNVLFGRSGGLDGQDAQAWSKSILGIDEAADDEHFGEVLVP